MILVKLEGIPRYVHFQIRDIQEADEHREKRQGIPADIVDILRSRRGTTYVFIRETPKGWWLALRIKMKGPSRLYRLVEVKELDLPSALLKASLRRKWASSLEKEVSKALRKGGLVG